MSTEITCPKCHHVFVRNSDVLSLTCPSCSQSFVPIGDEDDEYSLAPDEYSLAPEPAPMKPMPPATKPRSSARPVMPANEVDLQPIPVAPAPQASAKRDVVGAAVAAAQKKSPSQYSFGAAAGRQRGEPYELATRGMRLGTYLLDNLLINIISFPAGFVLGMSYGESAQGDVLSDADTIEMQVIAFVMSLLIAFTYYLVGEYFFHQTFGKAVMGTMVVGVDGAPPTFLQVLGRTCSRFIPLEHFTFLFSEHPAGLHDQISGTRVIQ